MKKYIYVLIYLDDPEEDQVILSSFDKYNLINYADALIFTGLADEDSFLIEKVEVV